MPSLATLTANDSLLGVMFTPTNVAGEGRMDRRFVASRISEEVTPVCLQWKTPLMVDTAERFVSCCALSIQSRTRHCRLRKVRYAHQLRQGGERNSAAASIQRARKFACLSRRPVDLAEMNAAQEMLERANRKERKLEDEEEEEYFSSDED